MPNYSPGLVRVLKEIGGPTRLAEQLGIVPSAVTQWTKVPARHIPRIEALTGLPGNTIRPDLYAPAKPKKRRQIKAAPKRQAKRQAPAPAEPESSSQEEAA